MVKDSELIELGFPEYWDTRYAAAQKGEAELESFEWFRDFQKLKPFFEAHLPAEKKDECHILHLGCGNSTLSADLYALSYTSQTSIDFSTVVISAMSTKYASLLSPTFRFLPMDVRSLSLPSSSIDIAIDKGTLDAFIHGSMWDPPQDVRENVGRYVDEVVRVLKTGGRWLYITYRQPHFMRKLLERSAWEVSVETLVDPEGGGGFDYFGYVMVKGRVVGETQGPEDIGTNAGP